MHVKASRAPKANAAYVKSGEVPPPAGIGHDVQHGIHGIYLANKSGQIFENNFQRNGTCNNPLALEVRNRMFRI